MIFLQDLHGRRIRVNHAVEKSHGGFPGFQGGNVFRDDTSYGGGGYGGGSRYRDSGAQADYTNRLGGGYNGSGTRNFASPGGSGGVYFFSSSADDDDTGKVHDDGAASHLSGGGPDKQDDGQDSLLANQPGDLEGENRDQMTYLSK
ncbi:hypothetical protein MLD38_034731 [Melastoma candidum]|uniref:Uncharacterized protein n=1 Tax=Melastoma candidum TaxID=119954 RepID=A0ACB9MES1_9MYRT|nr:hypothetical protein MLD38_034731 [Melastoma candidum]